MLTVTEQATGHLKKMLDRPEVPDGKCIRIRQKPDGLTLVYDDKSAGDKTFEHEGETVLVVEEELAQALDDKTIDLRQEQEGPTLVFG